jgi:ferrochelatase
LAGLERVAVVLFNLGGPDSPDAVEPFLFNLFRDPAIIALPNPLRWMVARLISKRRGPLAREIYGHMGGASPILGRTDAQADALKRVLETRMAEIDWHVEIVMRYWHPFADEAASRVGDFAPDRIVKLPLYPQFSTTTTGSSNKDWIRAAAAVGLSAPSQLICCYPDHPDFIAAQVELIAASLEEARKQTPERPLRLLLSAHGLPKKVIAKGDCYQWQVERTAAAISQGLAAWRIGDSELDIVTCYQSRVGPLEWIGPATEDEVKRAGAEGFSLVVAPIAFVSEHSETLVELDIEYAALARDCGVKGYTRVPALDSNEGFIACLADLVSGALGDNENSTSVTTGLSTPDACCRDFPCCPWSGSEPGPSA